MTNLTRTFLLCFLMPFLMTKGSASELWTKYEGSTRHYLVLDNDEGIKLKSYSQDQGDYQDLISVQSFKNFVEARAYVDKNYPAYVSTKALKNWPVDTSASEKKNGNIWTAQNQWSDQWEQNYADWLKATITSDFYMNYNIPTDCADAQIGFRWIFARMNSLPVANTVSDTGSLFGQFSMRKQWENLPTSANWYDDQLFLAALNYVMDMTSTRTIMASDGFHVAITQQGLRAGTFIVSQSNGSGHIRTITDNYYSESDELPLFTQSATSPRELRPLYKEAFVDQAWPLRGTREIMAMRWPIISRGSWILTDKTQDPRSSEEQFDTSLQGKYYSFIQFVLSRVKPSYNPTSLISTGIEDLSNYTTMRIKIVRDGYDFCRSHDCRQGTQGWEDWSTPSRDSKFLIKFNEIEDLVKNFDPANPGLYNDWINSLNTTVMDVEGHSLTLAQIKTLLVQNKMSYNPTDPILKRWGLN